MQLRERTFHKSDLLYFVVLVAIMCIGYGAYNWLNSQFNILGITNIDVAGSFIIMSERILLGLTTSSLALTTFILYRSQVRVRTTKEDQVDFLAIASHELRTPLTAVRWSLATLRSDVSLTIELRTMVNDIYDNICALIDLTSTFMQSASADHGIMKNEDLKIIDIIPVVVKSIAKAQSIAQMKKIVVKVESLPSLKVIVRGDPERLRLVFDNLLSNAIKYSPDGRVVTFAFSETGTKKVFTIADQGIGIPEKDAEAVFSGFHRASNAKRPNTPGSGFGLYMAKKIIDFHGGTLTCTSKLNVGTIFTITLPSGV